MTQMQEGEDDEDINAIDTSTPAPMPTSTIPPGPIIRARARQLNHQVSSLLSFGPSYLDNGDMCTFVCLGMMETCAVLFRLPNPTLIEIHLKPSI